MADLLASAVTIDETWTEGNTNGRKYSYRRCTVVLVAQGATGADIPAAAFQLSKIAGTSDAIETGSLPQAIFIAGVTTGGASLTLYDIVDTPPAALSPVAVTATVEITVWGTTL